MGRRRRMFSAWGAVACGGIFAILLWGKLKLVTGAPRTAFATDPAVAAGNDPAGSPSAGSPEAYPVVSEPASPRATDHAGGAGNPAADSARR